MLGACGISSGAITRSSKETEIIETRKIALTVMPNPSARTFTLNITGDVASTVILRVIDISGRIIETKNVISGQTIRIGDSYRTGVYFAEVIQGSERKIVKLVKIQ